MTIEERFTDAQQRVKDLATAPSNETLLELYGLYKQATAGDVQGSRPGIMDFNGRAKYDAWAAKKGTFRVRAMEAYVALAERLASGR
jgi:diazepam-binding inhibitor (GABA receptor modulating acyl-CoA-binding protein)